MRAIPSHVEQGGEHFICPNGIAPGLLVPEGSVVCPACKQLYYPGELERLWVEGKQSLWCWLYHIYKEALCRSTEGQT